MHDLTQNTRTLPGTDPSVNPTNTRHVVKALFDKPCPHDAGLQCSGCGSLMAGVDVCPDPSVHARRLGAGVTHATPQPSTRTYNTDWPRDDDGNALVTFTNRHTGETVTLPCFAPYRDPETQVTLPLCPCEPKLPGEIIKIVSGLSHDQFKERAAHLAGRDRMEHERMYFTVAFFRDYYFAGLHKDIQQHRTRAWRKRQIKQRHRAANCVDPTCRKRHHTSRLHH